MMMMVMMMVMMVTMMVMMMVMTRMLEAQHDVDLLPPGRLVPDITKLTHLTLDKTDIQIETDKN